MLQCVMNASLLPSHCFPSRAYILQLAIAGVACAFHTGSSAAKDVRVPCVHLLTGHGDLQDHSYPR